MLADPAFAKSGHKFQRALLGARRQQAVIETVRSVSIPVFTVYEWGHILINLMSLKTTEKLIEDLRYGGLLERTCCQSQLMLRRMIAADLDQTKSRRGARTGNLSSDLRIKRGRGKARKLGVKP